MQIIESKKDDFVKGITRKVSKMITKKYNCSLKEAVALFKNTKTYNFLAYSDDPFIEDGPEDFFELYVNEKKYGRMITNQQIRLEKKKGIFSKML
jgi:predicted proteasome-type protease